MESPMLTESGDDLSPQHRGDLGPDHIQPQPSTVDTDELLSTNYERNLFVASIGL